MEKLVRDKIPEIVSKARGKKAALRIASPAEYTELLVEKLREEVEEYRSNRNPEELIDIIEVIYHLAKAAGLSPEALEEMRRRKSEERGGFQERKVMDFKNFPPENF